MEFNCIKETDDKDVFIVKVCKYQANDAIKECIIKAIQIHLDTDPNFHICERDDEYICVDNTVITVGEMRNILERIIRACTIETSMYAYDSMKEWEKAMEMYKLGMSDFAKYLDYIWV